MQKKLTLTIDEDVYDGLRDSETYVTFRGKQSKAMADQLTTVSKKRLLNKAGEVEAGDMQGIAHAISVQLDL